MTEATVTRGEIFSLTVFCNSAMVGNKKESKNKSVETTFSGFGFSVAVL